MLPGPDRAFDNRHLMTGQIELLFALTGEREISVCEQWKILKSDCRDFIVNFTRDCCCRVYGLVNIGNIFLIAFSQPRTCNDTSLCCSLGPSASVTLLVILAERLFNLHHCTCTPGPSTGLPGPYTSADIGAPLRAHFNGGLRSGVKGPGLEPG